MYQESVCLLFITLELENKFSFIFKLECVYIVVLTVNSVTLNMPISHLLVQLFESQEAIDFTTLPLSFNLDQVKKLKASTLQPNTWNDVLKVYTEDKQNDWHKQTSYNWICAGMMGNILQIVIKNTK